VSDCAILPQGFGAGGGGSAVCRFTSRQVPASLRQTP
jgi:hypothetical protein